MVTAGLFFISGQQHWLRLAAGICAVGAGAATLVWPSTAVQVVGFLFGLNLVVIGTIRTALLVFLSGYPVLYRVAGICFGVVTAIVGVACLYHRADAVVLMLFVVAFGWVFGGVIELFLPAGDRGDMKGGWWIGTGLALMLAAFAALLRWPEHSHTILPAMGATVLIVVGLDQVVKAVNGLRREHHGSPVVPGP